MKAESYSNININDKVVFKENGFTIECIVDNIYYIDNNGKGMLKAFKLIPLTTDIFKNPFEVTCCTDDLTHCPWYFERIRK